MFRSSSDNRRNKSRICSVRVLVAVFLYCSCREFNNPLDTDRTDGLPPIPTDVRIIASSYRSVTLGFTYSYENSTGVIIYRNSIPLDTILKVNIFIDSMQVEPETEYIYKLRSYNENGTTKSTPIISVVTPKPLDPADVYGGITIQAVLEDSRIGSGITSRLTPLNLRTKTIIINLDSTGSAGSGFVLNPGLYAIETFRHGFSSAFDTISVSAGIITHPDTIVLRDILPPIFTQHGDTTVSIFDTLHFSAPIDSFYPGCTLSHQIIDTATGKMFYSYSGVAIDTNICFVTATNYLSIRTAKDIHGNLTADTSCLFIEIDLPTAQAGADTMITFSNGILLRGSESHDKLGRIEKYEWDIGGTGEFVAVSGGDTTIKTIDSMTICILRVTDDDGGKDTDEVRISSVEYLTEKVQGQNHYFTMAKHTCELFNDKIWVIGGQNAYSSVNNNPTVPVPRISTDGINWSNAPNAEMARRWGHSSLVFNDKLFVIGGSDQERLYHNDVLCCDMQNKWTKLFVNPGFIIPYEHYSVVFKEKMWIFDPEGNNIYSSTDGANWILEGRSEMLQNRTCCSIIAYKEKLWITGGYDYKSSGDVLNDVLSSTDGVTWTSVTQTGESAHRMNHASVVFDDKLWLIGGGWSTITFNTVCSIDGSSWTMVTDSCSFSARFQFDAIAVDNLIFCFGGMISFSNANGELWVLRK